MNLECHKESYKINYYSDKSCRILSDMAEFNADGFAAWLTEHLENSKFHSLAELAAAANLSRETLSRLGKGSSQFLTNKPSRPKPANLKAIARALNRPEPEALMAAGYAPFELSKLDEADALAMSLFFKHTTLTPSKKAEVRKLLEVAHREIDRIEKEERGVSEEIK